ncbi:lytic transglycosylase domain-containing protein [Roseovarius phycicola]|uniref:lytic transglycosylase domain-containing protein n=1 Tax=Roseovarius phycicola TaxID=3080976 RepID=UPI0030D03640
MLRGFAFCFAVVFSATLASSETPVTNTAVSPPAREANLPRTRWETISGTALWTRISLAALKNHGEPLAAMVPGDIADWCPAYPTSTPKARRAFWVGFVSTLVKHESTFRPYAVGGGGRWFGLTQISPSTARLYGCSARSGSALKDPVANLSCAIRIMAKTVPRDGVVSRGMRGVAADWGPLHSRKKRNDMMAWTKRQPYCKPLNAVRPRLRPDTVAFLSDSDEG